MTTDEQRLDEEPGPPEPPVLRLQGLQKTFGGVRAVADVSLQARRGERLGIIGPNGAGKTTLFRLISGEEKPSSGAIFVHERDVTKMPAHRRVLLGLGRTFQVMELFPTLTVREHFLLAGRQPLWGSFRVADRALRVAEELGLAGSFTVPASGLAYGQQRLVELGMTLCSGASILLLDEPAAGLGPADRILLRETLGRLTRDLTLVLVEHDIDLVLGLVDRVVCLSDGKIVAEDTPTSVRDNAVVQRVYLGATL